MGQREYVDFDLAIEDMGGGHFRARVLDSPSGQASAEFDLPFNDLELENFLLKIGRPRSGTRRLESPETEAARAFGERLFSAVFAGDVGTQWIRSIDAAEHDRLGLRLRLRLSEAPGLTELPWEYLYSPTNDDFVVLSSWTPMVRYISLDKGAPPLTVAPPLRMLAMVSSPTDYPPLDVEAEWARLDEGLGEIVDAGLIEIHRLEKATLRELQRALRRTDYHLFHFIGHGGFDAAADDGVLLLENDEGRAREVSGRQLGTILDDARTIRLSVLNACEGARASGTDPFAGVAQSLVARGIPAVVAMQFEISDRAAIIFAHEFYTAITDGMSVEAAVGEARRAIFGSKSDVEWGTAVLYMRAEDGRLFDLEALAARLPVEPTLEMEPVSPTIEVDAVTNPEPTPPAAGSESDEVISVRERAPTERSPVEAAPEGEAAAEPPLEPVPEVVALPVDVPQTEPVPEVVAVPDREQVEAEPIGEPEAPIAAEAVVEQEPHVAAEPVVESERPAEPQRSAEPQPITRPDDTGGGAADFVRSNARLLGAGAAVVILLLVVIVLMPNGDDTTGNTLAATTQAPTTQAPTTQRPTTIGGELEIIDSAAVTAVAAPALDIDADLGDWASVPVAYQLRHRVLNNLTENRLGDDATGTVWVAYDANNLYVAVDVVDDVYSQPNDGNQIWRGDAFDINLVNDSTDAIPARPDSHTFQLTMTPVSEPIGHASVVRFVGNGEQFADNTTDVGIRVEGVVDDDGDWKLEAMIPWSVFDMDGPPQRGILDAVVFSIFDNDGETSGGRTLQAEILTNLPGVFFQEPLTWGSLRVE